MADSVVCPVCRSRNTPGTPVCVTCGAPLLNHPRASADGGARLGAAVTGLPPGFPLWPVGESRSDVTPRSPSPRPGPIPPRPMAAMPGSGPAWAGDPRAVPFEMPVDVDAVDWTDDSEVAGPWGPDAHEHRAGWSVASPQGWGEGPTSTPPVGFRDDGAASQVGWLPVSAAPRSSKSVKLGDCWNCGEAKRGNREYCKRCGQRLDSDLLVQPGGPAHPLTPVSGGRGRRAVAFVWTVLVLAVVVVVGVVAFGGFVPRDLSASPASVAPASTVPQASPDAAVGSAAPGRSASPAVSLPATATGAPAATPPIATLPTATLDAGSPGPLATPTTAPRGTATPVPLTTPAPTPAPTANPVATLTPTPIPVVASTPTPAPISSATPGPVGTTASPRAPAPRGFTCSGADGARDPRNRGWRLDGTFWAEREGYDRVTLRLVPDPTLDGTVARVIVETLTLAELAARDLPAPSEGEMAVVIRFSPAVSLTRSLQASPERTAVRSLARLVGETGRVYTVLGVVGDGCTAVQAPMWADPSTQDTPFVDITVDVQH